MWIVLFAARSPPRFNLWRTVFPEDAGTGLVHHRGKDTSKGLRGHSSLNGATDAVICVERDKATDRRSWNATKMKEGEDGATGVFTLETVDPGTVDQFGIQDSSAAVKELTGAEAAVAASVPAPKGPHQKAVYDALKAAPNAHAGWSLKALLDVAKTALSGIGSQHRASRARTAVNGLVDRAFSRKMRGGILTFTSAAPNHPSPHPYRGWG